MIYYTSDIHFGQTSLLKNGRWHERPFQSLEEMHNAIVTNWNKKITNGDDVYILGDVGSRGFPNMHTELLSQLKGKKHLIVGNHDDISDARVKQQFVEICYYKKMTDNSNNLNKEVVLSHYPIMMWEGQHKGTILLYGHVHNTLEYELYEKYLKMFNKDKPPRKGEVLCEAYNVGMCLWNYTPISLKEILEKKPNNKKRA